MIRGDDFDLNSVVCDIDCWPQIIAEATVLELPEVAANLDNIIYTSF